MTGDRRVSEWVESMARAEMRAFMRMRRAFLDTPSRKRLRELRGAARRLRSLFDDFRDVIPIPQRKRLARLLDAAAHASEIAGVRRTLRRATDDRERELARPILRILSDQERRWLRYVTRAAANVRYRR